MTEPTILLHWKDISPNPLNRLVRGPIDESAPDMQELAESIGSQGLIQPLVVCATPEGPGAYQLLVGERRWRAARLLGEQVPLLPCIVKTEEMTYLEKLIFMGVENLQRENLPPVTEARYYQALQQEGLDAPAIARRTGKMVSHIKNRLELLDLALPVQAHIDAGRIPLTARNYLVRLPEALQVQVADRMVGQNGQAIKQMVELVLKQANGVIVPRKTARNDLYDYIWRIAGITLCEGCRVDGLGQQCYTCPGVLEFVQHLVEMAEARKAVPITVLEAYVKPG